MIPTGVYWPYTGATAPADWLICHGETIGDTSSGADYEVTPTLGILGDAITDGANGTPRTGAETKISSVVLNFIIKI